MQIIPFKEQSQWQAQITLTNVIFILTFKWNAQNAYWVMNIYDENTNPLVLGIKVVTNYDLTSQFSTLGLPTGDIVCQNILGQWDDIQRFDMGTITELLYYEPNEIKNLVSN